MICGDGRQEGRKVGSRQSLDGIAHQKAGMEVTSRVEGPTGGLRNDPSPPGRPAPPRPPRAPTPPQTRRLAGVE